MNSTPYTAVLLAMAAIVAACASSGGPKHTVVSGGSKESQVATVLDQLHDAASKADEARYFGLFDANGVFIGTDATERWTVEEFRAYAHPYFSQGKGWSYTPTSREVHFSDDGGTAWFHEMLVNEKWGVCRGSGVLVWRGGGVGWKIAQYNLSVPIPNDLLPEVAERMKWFGAGR